MRQGIHVECAVAMAENDIRQLKIKTGSVNRLRKELNLYSKEREQEQQRVDKLKQSGADSHDIRHAASNCSGLDEHLNNLLLCIYGKA